MEKVIATPDLSRESTIHDLENLKDVCSLGFVRLAGINKRCPRDGRPGAAYVNCLEMDDDHVGIANFMLSYSWSYTIGDIVDTLACYCKSSGNDPKRTYVWICFLCINQHPVIEQKQQQERSGRIMSTTAQSATVDFFTEFGDRVHEIGHVLAMMTPWHSPGYLQRIWCVYELYSAHTKGCKISIVMPSREKAALERDVFGEAGEGRGVDALYKVFAKTSVQSARASVEVRKEHHTVFLLPSLPILRVLLSPVFFLE